MAGLNGIKLDAEALHRFENYYRREAAKCEKWYWQGVRKPSGPTLEIRVRCDSNYTRAMREPREGVCLPLKAPTKSRYLRSG